MRIFRNWRRHRERAASKQIENCKRRGELGGVTPSNLVMMTKTISSIKRIYRNGPCLNPGAKKNLGFELARHEAKAGRSRSKVVEKRSIRLQKFRYKVISVLYLNRSGNISYADLPRQTFIVFSFT